MRPTKKIISIPVLAVVSLCLFFVLFIIFQRDIYQWWVNLVAPQPRILQIDISRRTIVQVYPNPDGIEWFGTKWTDDGRYIEIYDSRIQVYASRLMTIDPENATYTSNIQTLEDGNILGLVNELPFTLEDRESLWAGCEKENLFFTAKYLDNEYGNNNPWETRLWKGSQLIKIFPPIEFQFDMYQEASNDDPVGSTMEYSYFSSDCRYAVFSFGKDVWLLDTVEKSFSRVFTARQFGGMGHQFILPSWAPNNHDFAFGDETFGLEKYDVQSKKRSWLLAPGIAGGVIKWSQTGNWILGFSDQSMRVITPDGSKIGTLEGCENIQYPPRLSYIYTELPSWSPTEDKVAVICRRYDGKKAEIFLVIWDLSNLDSN